MSSSVTTEPRAQRLPLGLVIGGIVAITLIVGGALALVELGSTTRTPPNSNVGSVLLGDFLPKPRGVQPPRQLPPPPQLASGSGVLRAPWLTAHRPTVILFFADWCGPCHRELAVLGPVLGAGRIGPVQVVGLDEDGLSFRTAKAFVAAERLRFPVGWDNELLVATALVPQGVPATVYVRANGTIEQVQYGAVTVQQLDAGLSRLVPHAHKA